MSEAVRQRWASSEIRAVVAAFACLVLIAGSTHYSVPMYLALLTDRGIPLTRASAGASVLFVAGALGSIPAGWLLGRVQPKVLVMGAGVLAGGCVFGMGRVTNVEVAYLLFAGMGLSFIALGSLPLMTAVVRVTSPSRRPAALALATVGISAGGVLVSPVLAFAVSSRGAMAATSVVGGLLAVLVGLAAGLVMPRSPLVIAGDTAAPARTNYLAQPVFWLLASGFALFLAAQIGAVTHIVRLGAEHGLASPALLVPITTGSAVLARFITTAVLRRVVIWIWTSVICLCEAVSLVVLAATSGTAGAVVGAILLGMAVGSAPLLMPLTQIAAFGIDDFPRLSARVGLVAAAGQAVGPIVLSIVHDATGGYLAAYLTGAVLCVGAAGLVSVTGHFVGRHHATAGSAVSAPGTS